MTGTASLVHRVIDHGTVLSRMVIPISGLTDHWSADLLGCGHHQITSAVN